MKVFTFDDVLIEPKFSFITSRQLVNTETDIDGLKFKLPVISANMDTVTGVAMANAMIGYGAQACLHRFCSIEENVAMFKATSTGSRGAMVSVGLGDKELERAKALFDAGAHTFVVDVAHAAQINVVEQSKRLREIISNRSILIVGNFASSESVKTFLEHSGDIVNAVKVGIGPGSACTTRVKTGVGYPQLSAVLEISQALKNTGVKIIADGGMKTPGDIAKALGAGAHMVMLGGMLAGTYETPGELIDSETGDTIIGYSQDFLMRPISKKYRGSASQESYALQGKDAAWRTAEGESFTVSFKGSVNGVLQDIEGGLRSSMSYVGAANLKEFHNKVTFIHVTPATVSENGSHGKKQ